MNIQFANRKSSMLHEALGISNERANEISDGLDQMVRSYKAMTIVTSVELIEKILAMVNTDEEFVYAYTNHLKWLHRSGRAIDLHDPVGATANSKPHASLTISVLAHTSSPVIPMSAVTRTTQGCEGCLATAITQLLLSDPKFKALINKCVRAANEIKGRTQN